MAYLMTLSVAQIAGPYRIMAGELVDGGKDETIVVNRLCRPIEARGSHIF
jgi:hypothetical protein